MIFGLNSDEWTAIAAIAQALAAVGAIALLGVAFLSQRDAKKVIDHSERLAIETRELALASRAAQALAVMPVIEVSIDGTSGRIHVMNRGNGPLLHPRLNIDGRDVALVSQDAATLEYREFGALPVGVAATAILDVEVPANCTLSVTGWTMTGQPFTGHVTIAPSHLTSVMLAREL